MLRRKWLRVLILSVSGLVASGVALLLAGYFILKSPAMQQKIILSLKEPLAKQGVDLSVQSLSIDVLAGVHLEGLKATIKRAPEMQGSLGIEDLRVRYAIWPLLNRKLEIREVKLVGVTGDMALNLPPSPPDPPPDPEALTKLLDLLRHPPVSIDLGEFALERVTIHIQLTQGPMKVDLTLTDMHLKSSLALSPGVSALTLDAGLPLVLRFEKGKELALETALVVEPRVIWDSNLHDDHWQWNLKIDDTTLKMGPTHFAQGQGPTQLLGDFKDLLATLKLALKHEGKVPARGVAPEDLALPLDASGSLGLEVRPMAFSDQKSKSQGSLGVKADLSFDAQVPRDLKKPEDVSWTLKNQLAFDQVEVFQAKQKLVAVPRIDLSLTGTGAAGKGDFEVDLKAAKIALNALAAALNLDTHLVAKVDLPQKDLDLKTRVAVNSKEALLLSAKVSDRDHTLAAKVALDMHSSSGWRELHKNIGQLDLVGWPSAHLTTDLTVAHEEPLENVKDWSKLPITNALSLQVLQSSEREKALAKWKVLSLQLNAKTQDKNLEGGLVLHVERLEHKALRKPIDIDQDLTFNAQFADLIRAKVKGLSKLDGKERVDLMIDALETPKRFQVKDQVVLKVDPSLKSYVKGLEILDDVGHLTLETKDVLTVSYAEKRIKDVKNWDPGHINAEVASTLRMSQAEGKLKYRLQAPVDVQTQGKLSHGTVAMFTRVHAPRVEAEALAAVKDLDARIDLNVDNIATQDRVDVKVLTGIRSVKPLMESAAKVQDLIQNLTLRLRAQVLQKDKFFIHELVTTVDGALLNVKGKGDMALSTGRGGFLGSVKSQLPPGRSIAGLKGSGGFEVPFSITLYDKKVLALQSEPRFDKLSFTFGDIQVDGMDGKLSLAEELNIDDKGRIGFLYLDTQNPFTRVDFENIDPYLGQRLGLKINKLRFKHIIAGPMLANIELRQNLVLLNEMKANLLNGSALGRVFVDLHPERLQLGFLGRFSNLQLELLKEPALRQKRDDELSGRAAVSFDIRKRLATGRIDVTSIGRNQLLSMIDVLDPEYKDTQMMAARRALQLSYPSLVSISMEQGLMDLMIGLGGALSTDLTVRSIPLTAFINANAGEQLLTLEKFLQTGGQ